MSEALHARPEGRTWLGQAADDPLASFPGILDCVHCGLCLSACPTYVVTGRETDSPRGRIALLRASAEGRLRPPQVRVALERCLLCRACEPACPSQVPYHKVVERHREGAAPWLLRWVLRRLLPSRRRLAVLGGGLRLLRAAGLLGLVERGGPRRWRALAGAVPTHPKRHLPRAGTVFPARTPQRGRVGLHLGCVNPELFGDVLRDTVELLTAQGFEVVTPEQPACCGALHAHCGESELGHGLAAATLQAFPPDLDAVVAPAAGCAAHLRAHRPDRVEDPMLLLHRFGMRALTTAVPLRVAYDPPCHLQHVVGGAQRVAELLRQVPGLELVPLSEAELCCGAGGITFAQRPDISDAVLERKLEWIEQSGAEVVASGNPGCLLRLGAGLRRRRSPVHALHPASLLARAAQRPRDNVLR